MTLSQTTASIAPTECETGVALSLEGDFVRPLTLTLGELNALGSDAAAGIAADPFDLRCYTTNRFIRTVGSYRGVLLKELILRAGLRSHPPGEFKRTVFLAVAHDGYVVTFSWHELFNTPVGERVLIAHECDGRPLNPEDGAPILFSGADILPAPRHVKRLARVVARVLAA
jgi:DMSO/TMAO reductase YedYZ molybdopterin-dependent catalytic subunit